MISRRAPTRQILRQLIADAVTTVPDGGHGCFFTWLKDKTATTWRKPTLNAAFEEIASYSCVLRQWHAHHERWLDVISESRDSGSSADASCGSWQVIFQPVQLSVSFSW